MSSKRNRSEGPSAENSAQDFEDLVSSTGRPKRRAATRNVNYSLDSSSYRRALTESTAGASKSTSTTTNGNNKTVKNKTTREKRMRLSEEESIEQQKSVRVTRSLRSKRVSTGDNEEQKSLSQKSMTSSTKTNSSKGQEENNPREISDDEDEDQEEVKKISSSKDKQPVIEIPGGGVSDDQETIVSEESDDPIGFKNQTALSVSSTYRITRNRTAQLEKVIGVPKKKPISLPRKKVLKLRERESEDDSDFVMEPRMNTRSSRRSQRTVSQKKVSYKEDEDYMVISEEEDDTEEVEKVKKKAALPKREKKRIVISESSSSDSSDTKNEFEAAHQKFCQHCNTLGYYNATNNRKYANQDKVLMLCEYCSSAYHRGCVAEHNLNARKFKCLKCLKEVPSCLECGVSRLANKKKEKDDDDDSESEVNSVEDGLLKLSIETGSGFDRTFFRCHRCYYTAHYRCLQPLKGELRMNSDTSLERWIKMYRKDCKCIECLTWDYEIDKILTYEVVPKIKKGKNVAKASIDNDRRYLVKFKQRSYRKVDWVSERWLMNVSPSLFRSFKKKNLPPLRKEDVIQSEWTKVDRVLDVFYENDAMLANIEFANKSEEEASIYQVKQAYVKWQGLTYEEATWEEDLDPNDQDFKVAYKERLNSMKIKPGKKIKSKGGFREFQEQPSYIPGKLMDYQKDGVNGLEKNLACWQMIWGS
ncbi:2481_t:CDS:2, partial [Ambispora leptoticha]